MSFDLEKEEQEYRKYKAEHTAGKMEKQNKSIDEDVKPGSGIRDFYVTIGLLLFQFVLTLIIAPFLIKDALNEHTFQFFGIASAYASAVGLLITVVRNRRSYRRYWLIPCAIVLFVTAILECRYVGAPAASILFIVYFQIKNNNGKLRDELVVLASTLVAAGIISIATLNMLPPTAISDETVYVNNPLEQNYENSLKNVGCRELSTEDSFFVKKVFTDVYQNTGMITKEIYERFNEIRKKCPSWMAKPDWSDYFRLSVLYYEDMVNTIKQQKLIISEERVKLGKSLYDLQNRNLEKVLNGDLIIENYDAHLVDLPLALEALENQKKIVSAVQARLDSLYDTTLVFDDSRLLSDSIKNFQDSIHMVVLNNIEKERESCNLTSADSEFVFSTYEGIWNGSLPITKKIHQRFQEIYKKCYLHLLPPNWSHVIAEDILFYEDLASSMNRGEIVVSDQRKMFLDSVVRNQNAQIAEYLKKDTIYPEDGGAPFVLDSEDVVYNLKKYQEKAIVALKKLDSLYNDSLYMK